MSAAQVSHAALDISGEYPRALGGQSATCSHLVTGAVDARAALVIPQVQLRLRCRGRRGADRTVGCERRHRRSDGHQRRCRRATWYSLPPSPVPSRARHGHICRPVSAPVTSKHALDPACIGRCGCDGADAATATRA
eukprot:1183034-Prorocentrum_minimum.AAC.5